MKARISFAVMAMGSLLLVSCASTPVPKQSREPTTLPGPATFNIHGTITLDLPEAWAKDLKVPPKAKGALTAKAEAKVSQENPVRTHYSADISLVITDPTGTQQYVDFATQVTGEMDGRPASVSIEALRQLAQAVTLWAQSINVVAPKTRESQHSPPGDRLKAPPEE